MIPSEEERKNENNEQSPRVMGNCKSSQSHSWSLKREEREWGRKNIRKKYLEIFDIS